MKITLFTNNDEACTDIISVKAAHISMFDKDFSVCIYFIDKEEQMKFIKACVDNYVLIEVQGTKVKLKYESYQRVRVRFDS